MVYFYFVLWYYVIRIKTITEGIPAELTESANRVVKILKERVNSEIKPELFKDKSEHELYENMLNIEYSGDYKKYINDLNTLVPSITAFFDNVLVFDKDDNVKNNRLALLTKLTEKFEKLCDFSKM